MSISAVPGIYCATGAALGFSRQPNSVCSTRNVDHGSLTDFSKRNTRLISEDFPTPDCECESAVNTRGFDDTGVKGDEHTLPTQRMRKLKNGVEKESLVPKTFFSPLNVLEGVVDN